MGTDHKIDERMRAMIDAAPFCAHIWDCNIKLIDCNEATVKLFKLSDKQEYIDNFNDFSPEYQPDGRLSKEAGRSYIKKAFEEGHLTTRWTHKTLDGELIPSEMTFVRVEDADDSFVAVYFRDIREEKQWELETATLRTIFDSIPDFVFCKDLNLKYTRINKRMEDFFGVKEADVIGKDDAEGLGAPEEMVRLCNESDQVLLKTGQSTTAEEYVPGDDGTMILCETVKVPIMNGDEIVGLLGLSHDITERKKVEDAILLRETTANTLNEMASVFLAQDGKSFEEKMTVGVKLIADMLDLDSVSVWRDYLVSNDLYTSQIYRWDRESGGTTSPRPQLQNIPFFQLTPHWEKILVGEKVLSGPVSLMEEPPAAFKLFGVVSALLMPLFFNNEHWGFVLFEDLHNERYFEDADFMRSAAFLFANTVMRSEMENSLKEALNDATAASRAKSDFLANMSHEIRTPLNAIIGMTSIGTADDDPDKMKYCFAKIEDASKHLLGVINDILDMSKIEAGKFELSPTEFKLENIIERVVGVFNFRIAEKKQKLDVSVDEAIPEILIGDDQRLAQVITNLLSNAVKFTPVNGSISIEAGLMEKESDICTLSFSVTDSGIGISPEQQAKLFQSFQQAETQTSRKFGGTGLGLAISKSIVEMMGGEVAVESEEGKGSTFSFTVQMKIGDSLGLPEQKPEETKLDIQGIFKGHRILLAEDVEINREIVLALLESTDLEIDCAANGVEAVQMFSEAPDRYEMIFMDVQMPEMDGYRATKTIRALDMSNAKTIPIVAMTANVFREDVEKCLQAGMNSHIGKPIDINEVIAQLRSYIK